MDEQRAVRQVHQQTLRVRARTLGATGTNATGYAALQTLFSAPSLLIFVAVHKGNGQ